MINSEKDKEKSLLENESFFDFPYRPNANSIKYWNIQKREKNINKNTLALKINSELYKKESLSEFEYHRSIFLKKLAENGIVIQNDFKKGNM